MKKLLQTNNLSKTYVQTQGFFSSCVLPQCDGVGAVLCSHARNVLAYSAEILNSNISNRFGICALQNHYIPS